MAGSSERDDDMKRLDRLYEKVEPKLLGQGTYGKVYKARNRKTGRVVAMKKMSVDWDEEGLPSTFLREISLLKALSHPNVVALLDVFTPSAERAGTLVLIFEFLDLDLKKFMKVLNNDLSSKIIHKLAQQVCCGVEFCHEHLILHRDLKPQNLLIDNSYRLKLADFGLARGFTLAKKYTQEVVTVWYRAPELLLGSGLYSAPIDLWSVGCVLAEMAVGKPLFDGDSEIDTIFKIFRMLGTPTQDSWPGLTVLPNFRMSFPSWPSRTWAACHECALEKLEASGVELISSLLIYDPKKRASARNIVRHPYFSARCAAAQTTPHKEKERLPLSSADNTQTPAKVSEPPAETAPLVGADSSSPGRENFMGAEAKPPKRVFDAEDARHEVPKDIVVPLAEGGAAPQAHEQAAKDESGLPSRKRLRGKSSPQSTTLGLPSDQLLSPDGGSRFQKE